MAKEYIEREAAIAAVDCTQVIVGDWIRNNIQKIPTADVRPVARGKWRANGKFENCENCTLCGCAVLKAEYDPILRINGKYLYCPNCGADMREVDDED